MGEFEIFDVVPAFHGTVIGIGEVRGGECDLLPLVGLVEIDNGGVTVDADDELVFPV